MKTIAILTPTRTKPTKEYEWALQHNSPQQYHHFLCTGLPVDEARNRLAAHVKAMNPRPEVCVWVDDDAFWFRGAIERLVSDLDLCSLLDCVSCLCCARGVLQLPAAYMIDPHGNFHQIQIPPPNAEPPIRAVSGTGLHMLVHRTALLDALPKNPFTIDEQAEDVMFCKNVRQAGGTILLDSLVPVAHIDGDYAFLPGAEAFEVVDGRLRPVGPIKTLPVARSYGPVHDSKVAPYDEVLKRYRDFIEPRGLFVP